MVMQVISKRIVTKSGLLAAIAIFSLELLTACTNPPQQSSSNSVEATSVEPTPTPETMAGMNHDHSTLMDLGSSDAEYDLRFIDAMILHHEGAIEMAQIAKRNSTRSEIQNLSTEIIDAQTKEISDLKQWRKNWYPQAGDQPMAYNSQQQRTLEMSTEQVQNMKMNVDLGLADAEFDRRFIDAMIVHHEGAVDMAKSALKSSQRPEIKTLSQNIITAQEQEISQMQEWRKAWYNQ